MNNDGRAALRDLIRRESEAASAEAVESGGQVSAERVARLQQLSKLLEIHQSAHPPRPPSRWPIAAVLCGSLLVASALLFLRVPSTDVELRVVASEVGFTLAASQELLRSTPLSALGVSGLRGVELPSNGRAAAHGAIQSGDPTGPTAVRLAPDSLGPRRGTVDLAPITLPSSTEVRVQQGTVPHQFRLSFATQRDSAIALEAHVFGLVSAAVAGSPSTRLDLAAPKSVTLVPGSGDVDLDLTFSSPVASVFAQQLAVRALALDRVDQTPYRDETIARILSTIRSGTLYLESLGGEARQLRPGESLAFAETRGSIRSIELREDGVALEFAGRVRGMRIGFADGGRSLMPTWLEWLKARHGLSLMWGTAFYLFGLVLGIARWWRSAR